MIAVVAPERVADLTALLENAGERVWCLGRLVPGDSVILKGAESAWQT
jgi:hypothetical protein